MQKGKLISELKNTSRMPNGEAAVRTDLSLHTGVVRESPVDVLFMVRDDVERFIRIRVHSNVRPKLHRYSDFPVAGMTQNQVQQKCGVVAGIIAEQLGALYGDTVDPSDCARWAGRHFRELCDHLEKQRTLSQP